MWGEVFEGSVSVEDTVKANLELIDEARVTFRGMATRIIVACLVVVSTVRL